jgi:hypothetical protein
MRLPFGDHFGLLALRVNVSRWLPLPSGRTVKMSDRSSGPGWCRTSQFLVYAIRPSPAAAPASAAAPDGVARASCVALPATTPAAVTIASRAVRPRLNIMWRPILERLWFS